MLDRKVAPPIINAVDTPIHLEAIEHKTLSNGLPMYFYSGGEQDIFQLELDFPCGSWVEAHRLETLLMSAQMKQGTAKHNAMDFNEALDFYGSSLSISYDYDIMTISLKGLNKYLSPLLDLLIEMMTSPVFDAGEFDSAVKRFRQGLEINLTKSEFIAQREFDKLIYGFQHPYGVYSLLSDFDNLKREEIVDFYNTKFALADAKIYFSGKFSAEEIALVSDKLCELSSDKKSQLPSWDFAPIGDTEKKHNIILKDDALQSSICAGRLFVDNDHPDFLPMVLLNVTLGGYFGSRLMDNIREDKGYTYGIYSSIRAYKHSSMLKIQTDVNRSVADDTLTQIRIEMDRLCQEKIDEDELLTVKNYLLSNILSKLDGPFQIMGRWKSLIARGYGKDRFDKSIEIYRNTTADELMVLAQKYYALDDQYLLTVS